MNTHRGHAKIVQILLTLCCFVGVSFPTGPASADDFIRGDVSTDGKLGITDAAILGQVLHGRSPTDTRCDDAMDIDDDGNITVDDFAILVEFLTELSETTDSFLEDPFPDVGTDDSPDDLLCQSGSGSELGILNEAYIFDWDVPPQSEFVPRTEVDIFLTVTLLQAINGFSLAYRLNTSVLNLISVDFTGVEMERTDRLALESSPAFSWSLAGSDDSGFSLLLVATVLRDRFFQLLNFPPTQGAVTEFPLLHLRASVGDVAPAAGTILLEPFDGTYLGIGELGGTANEVSPGFFQMPLHPATPTIPILDDAAEIFFRGDSNADTVVDISDGIHTLGFIFQGGPKPAILDAADANDDGTLDISDAVYTFRFLFQGGPQPQAPFMVCDRDPTTDQLFSEGDLKICAP